MKYAVMSDVHANPVALAKTVDYVRTCGVDGVPYIHQGGGRPAMAFAETVRKMGFGLLSNDGK